MDGQSSGFVSGAASGAVMGATVGGPWGAAIGGIVGGVAGLFSGSANDAQAASQQAWAAYNAQQQYNVTSSNVMSQALLSSFNVQMIQNQAATDSQNVRSIASYNAGVIQATTLYNDSLLENELSVLWEEAELDIQLLGTQRARERGGMVAQQAASGTVIGEGSNVAVVIDQIAQEKLDAFIVRHGADIKAANINNQRAQSVWQGDMAVKQTIFEGEMSAYSISQSAANQSAGILASSAISGASTMRSAKSQLASGMAGGSQAASSYSARNTQSLVSGLFSTAGQAGTAYAASKTPSKTSLLE